MTTNTELRVQGIYDSLSNAEKKAAAYFLSHVESVFSKPIAELAEESGVSKVAWVRFCKAIGFDGLKDLKKHLFNELFQNTDTQENDAACPDIRNAAGIGQLIISAKNNTIRGIQDAARLLEPAAVEEAAKMILRARSVRIFGLGGSAPAAEDLYGRLLRTGRNACFSSDRYLQLSYASNMGPDDTAVLFSASGKTSEILEILSLAGERHAPTIAVTAFGRNPLAVNSDIRLYISAAESSPRSGAMNSRIAQLMAVDILFAAITQLSDPAAPAPENILQNERAHRFRS